MTQNGTNTKEFQYFSFTTLTTLGYGDFTAVGDGGRAFAVLEAMIGQMFLATLVARLVAGLRWSDRAAARRGARPAAMAAGQGSAASGPGQDESRAVAAPASPGSGDAAAGQPAQPQPPRPRTGGRRAIQLRPFPG